MKPNKFIINKNLGETPLQALERYRAEQVLLHANLALWWKTVPMTYAGRLDPMAEGDLLILIDEECKNKDKYLELDKEYEVELVLGISTDSYDSLGLPSLYSSIETVKRGGSFDVNTYIGKFNQPYPPYSSKTIDGEQMHSLARSGKLPSNIPFKEVTIYSLEIIESRQISSENLNQIIQKNIDLVIGDFRQEEIKKCWSELFNLVDMDYSVIKIKVKCSSGTYMRSLVNRIGKNMKTGAFALSIKRTKIFI